MSLPFQLDEIRRRPCMYLPSASFDAAAAYLMGIDAAGQGEFLKGFREWLIPTVDSGNNFAWTELILRIAFPQAEDPRGLLRNPFNEVTAIGCLFRCLEEFLAMKQSNQGLRSILLRYQDWLKSQDWYSPSSRSWVEADSIEG